MRIKKINPVAKYSRNKSGAGAHKSKKDYRRQEKHRNKEQLGYYPTESVANKIDRLILLEKMQNHTLSASIWFSYEEEIQALRQELSEIEI